MWRPYPCDLQPWACGILFVGLPGGAAKSLNNWNRYQWPSCFLCFHIQDRRQCDHAPGNLPIRLGAWSHFRLTCLTSMFLVFCSVATDDPHAFFCFDNSAPYAPRHMDTALMIHGAKAHGHTCAHEHRYPTILHMRLGTCTPLYTCAYILSYELSTLFGTDCSIIVRRYL